MADSTRGTVRKQVGIDQVTVGMYLEDVSTERGVLLISRDISVQSETQIQALRQRGVQKVTINVQKGKDVVGAPPVRATVRTAEPSASAAENQKQAELAEREAAYYRELSKAHDVHAQTVETATEVLRNIKNGRTFSTVNVRGVSESIAESIARNPDALVSLTQIKGFDEYTYTHSVNVGILVTSLAAEMGYKGESLVEVSMGGLLHDIGKMRVPDSILKKPGKLTDLEFTTIKRHPEMGIEIIGDRPGIPDITRKMISQHHERFNGKGYPLGLAGARIHEAGLITAVADVFDALTSDRVYKEAWTPQRALAMIFNGCDVDYSRRIAELFARHMGIYPVGSFVRLVSGEMAVVVRVDRGHLLAPRVLVLFDKGGKRHAKPVEYDLLVKQNGPEGAQYRIEVSLDPKAYSICVSDFL
ncbi:MAG: HD-GYP domain-containing protein [Fibrobacterota bacterium]